MKFNREISFGRLLLGVICLSMVPVISWPLEWLETFFHEMSHGLLTLVTGGSIVGFSLQLNGGGFCLIKGGTDWIISWAGYGGAVFWGGLIYLLALGGTTRNHAIQLAAILGAVTLSAILWAEDRETLVILLILYVLGMVAIFVQRLVQKKGWQALGKTLQFTGIYILVSAIRSPLFLLLYAGKSDASDLQKITGLPQFFWIASWEAVALYALFFLWWKSGERAKKRQRAARRKAARRDGGRRVADRSSPGAPELVRVRAAQRSRYQR